jgi:hypothetical protein
MEPQTPIDVQRILDRKRKRAEYDKQRKLILFFDDTATTEIYTKIDTRTLHDALPICVRHIHDPMFLP